MTNAQTNGKPKTYALVSHESAVEAVWALAARNWKETLYDENIWLVPAADICVTTQGDLERLKAEVDLSSLGIRHDPIDLLVPNKSCYSRGKHATFHVWREFFPPHSFVRVHDRVLVSTPYFATLQLATARRPNRLSRAAAEASAAEDVRIWASTEKGRRQQSSLRGTTSHGSFERPRYSATSWVRIATCLPQTRRHWISPT